MNNKKGLGNVSLAILFLLVFSILFLCLSSNFIFAASSGLNVTKENAESCINDSINIMGSMSADGFNVVRINDTIREIQSLYDSQIILMDKKRPYDFSKVIEGCNNVIEIQSSAVIARDQLGSLLKFYNESLSSAVNTSSADVIILEIKNEIKDERYENVPALIDKAYNEIAAIQASQSAMSIFYSATSKGLKVFFARNWKVLTGVVVVLVILFLIYRVKISLIIVSNKIAKLKNKKETIKELVMKTQKDYFQYGKIPEGEYNIKTKKYAELIRDIDRQIPLLQEELAKLQSYRNK